MAHLHLAPLRPALTLGSLEAFIVLGLAANFCYCAAYVAEFFTQALMPNKSWRFIRQTLFVLGTLFALVLENYSIADEIYPYADHPPASLFGGTDSMSRRPHRHQHEFPRPARHPRIPRRRRRPLSRGRVDPDLLVRAQTEIRPHRRRRHRSSGGGLLRSPLRIFSAGSRETVLAHGQEKYFCEIDCHLAYSVVDAKPQPDGHLVITLRTRFDETTTSPNRPKDAPLTPSPREVRLVDSTGHEYAPVATTGTPLLTPLKPADSYTTQLEFNIPKESSGLRLLINTTPQWPDKLVIGDENSWLHKKTYLSL